MTLFRCRVKVLFDLRRDYLIVEFVKCVYVDGKAYSRYDGLFITSIPLLLKSKIESMQQQMNHCGRLVGCSPLDTNRSRVTATAFTQDKRAPTSTPTPDPTGEVKCLEKIFLIVTLKVDFNFLNSSHMIKEFSDPSHVTVPHLTMFCNVHEWQVLPASRRIRQVRPVPDRTFLALCRIDLDPIRALALDHIGDLYSFACWLQRQQTFGNYCGLHALGAERTKCLLRGMQAMQRSQ